MYGVWYHARVSLRIGGIFVKKTTIYFPEELTIEIKTRAKQERRTEAALIREAVSTYLANGKRRLPSFVGMASDGSFNAADDEQYLAEHWKPDW
jgi:hypothetical protein